MRTIVPRHPIDEYSGLLWSIHCRGLGKTKGRAEGRVEYEYWKDLFKRMYAYLMEHGYNDDCRQLRAQTSFQDRKDGCFIFVNGESWHIFTFALRALDAKAYHRMMDQKRSSLSKTGWGETDDA